jgi:hypothetical protein
MTHIRRWNSDKSDAYDSRPKNNDECILKYRRHHLNQLPHTREKIQQRLLLRKMLEPLSDILHGGRAAGSPRPMVHFGNVTLHRSVATEIAFSFANFDMLSSHRITRISVQLTSFSSTIRKGSLRMKNSTRQKSSKRELRNYLVSSRRKQCNGSMSTGPRDCSKRYTPMKTTSKAKCHNNSPSAEQCHHSQAK